MASGSSSHLDEDEDYTPLFRVAVQRKSFSGDKEEDRLKSRFQSYAASSFARAYAFGGGGFDGDGGVRVGAGGGSADSDAAGGDGGSDDIRKGAGFLKNLRDNTYNCHVEIGNGQKFMVDLDTGSADTWFRGPDCKAKDDSCNGDRVNVVNDPSLKATGIPFSTHYGQGFVKGKIYIGDVKIGEATAKNLLVGLSVEEEADGDTDGILGLAYSSISQIAKQTKNAVRKSKQDRKAGSHPPAVDKPVENRKVDGTADVSSSLDDLKKATGSSSIRFGTVRMDDSDSIDSSPNFRWSSAERDSSRLFGKRNAEEEDRNLLSLTDEQGRSVGDAQDDEAAASVVAGHSNFVDALRLPANRNMFGFYLSYSRDGDHGEVVFGGYDKKRVEGDVKWFKVNSPSYWQFGIEGFTYRVDANSSVGASGSVMASSPAAEGAEAKPLWTESVGNAIADTGTTLILLDSAVADDINTRIGGHKLQRDGAGSGKLYGIDCANMEKDGPVVKFIAPNGGGTFELGPKAYILRSGAKSCITGFSGASANGVAIFGDIFLRQYYSIYDRGGSRLGFAKAVHAKLDQGDPEAAVERKGTQFVKERVMVHEGFGGESGGIDWRKVAGLVGLKGVQSGGGEEGKEVGRAVGGGGGGKGESGKPLDVLKGFAGLE
ncbi:hypothetical protein HDU67_002105 [Dinochytrium kinnereticum]|nr:hypothetical protein HDU67_002105 [Dinochytrium kinnereticum]